MLVARGLAAVLRAPFLLDSAWSEQNLSTDPPSKREVTNLVLLPLLIGRRKEFTSAHGRLHGSSVSLYRKERKATHFRPDSTRSRTLVKPFFTAFVAASSSILQNFTTTTLVIASPFAILHLNRIGGFSLDFP